MNSALIKEIESRKVIILPALIEDCELPHLLKDKRYADFRNDFDMGISSLLEVLRPIDPDDEYRIICTDDGENTKFYLYSYEKYISLYKQGLYIGVGNTEQKAFADMVEDKKKPKRRF
jgi:hypothetical protein